MCTHEISHFYFFRKYEEYQKKGKFLDYKHQHKVWILSEAIVPLIYQDKKSIDILGNMPNDTYVCSDEFLQKELKSDYEEFSKKNIKFDELVDRFLQKDLTRGVHEQWMNPTPEQEEWYKYQEQELSNSSK